MQPWSRAFLHKQLNTLLDECSADELRWLLIALGDEEHPRCRQPFFERVQRHRLAQGRSAANAVDDDDLGARLDAMAMELAATAESEEPGWWEEEDDLGPFEALMPGVLALLEAVGERLRQGDAMSACQAYERIWAMLEVEDDYGHRPSLESHDRDTAREQAARYLRAVLLASDPGEQVTAMLEAVERVRFSGFTANPALRYLTLREVAEVEATPIAGWAAFLDTLLTALAEPEDALQAMWLREALQMRQGGAGLAALARRQGTEAPEAWLDWIRTAVVQGDLEQAVTAWQEAQAHFGRRAEIWRYFADLILSAPESRDLALHSAIAFEALLANPTPQRLLTLWEALPDVQSREASIREAALCLTAPAKQGNDEQGDGASSPSRKVGKALAQLAKRETPGRYLAHVSRFENWAPVAVLAWLLVGERQRAKALATEQGDVVGWSLGDNPRWALFCGLPVMLAGRPVEERGTAMQTMWCQLVHSGTWGPWGNGSAEQAATGAGRDMGGVAAERLSEALLEACRRYPLAPSEIHEGLQWCFDTARARCHSIVSQRHRQAYGRAACCVAACVEAASAMGRATAGQAFLDDIRRRYPRHTAFQRAVIEWVGEAAEGRT